MLSAKFLGFWIPYPPVTVRARKSVWSYYLFESVVHHVDDPSDHPDEKVACVVQLVHQTVDLEMK